MKKILILMAIVLLSTVFADHEPNSSCNQAEVISKLNNATSVVSTTITGKIVQKEKLPGEEKPDYERDYYYFNVATNGTVNIKYTATGSTYIFVGTRGCNSSNIHKEWGKNYTINFQVTKGQRVDIDTFCRWNRSYTITATFTPTNPTPPPKPSAETFIKKLYENTLNRSPDTSGLNYYKNEFSNNKSATSIAKMFFESPEFKAKNLSNEELITVMYETLLNRKPDSDGLNYWKNYMNKVSNSQNLLFYNLTFSDEFQTISDEYDIIAFDSDDQLSAFVERFYIFVLERPRDEAGYLYWIEQLKSHQKNSEDIAKDFLYSEEFLNKNVSNEHYVEILYRTLMNREASESDINYWVDKLNNGMTREELITEFLSSDEFTDLLSEYGL